MKKNKISIVALVVIMLLGGAINLNAQDNTLLGAGATFPYPLYSKIFTEYQAKKGVKINYQSIGSGGGILQLTNKTVDFGASDAFLNADQTAKMGAPVVHIPIVAGAVVLTYNLPGNNNHIVLTPDVIADIFLGKIKSWKDARITSKNKGVNIPNLPILVAHRSDGSGTSSIFTNYLSDVSAEWKSKVGAGTAVNWPVGLGGKGNEGVTGLVKQTPGSIGYVELIYALQNKLDYAVVVNKSGKVIEPSLASVTAAMKVKIPADAKVLLVNSNNPAGYSIAGLTWIIVYKEQNYNGRSAAKAKELVDLLWWAIHDGEKFATPLNYSSLSPDALKVAEKNIKSVTYNGKPIL